MTWTLPTATRTDPGACASPGGYTVPPPCAGGCAAAIHMPPVSNHAGVRRCTKVTAAGKCRCCDGWREA